LQPIGLGHAVGDNTLFRLSTRAGDDVLTLGRLGDQVIPKKHRVARGGSMGIWTPSPISISVDDELGGGGSVKEKTKLRSAMKIL
jgi:hypothetical protein